MDSHNRHQLPIFDLNNLDEDHEILIDYDRLGNPTRIRKVRRFQGCASTFFVIIIIAMVAVFWNWHIR